MEKDRELLNKLIETVKLYCKDFNELEIIKAYEFGKKYYEGMTRPTGISTLTHSIEVAQIIADLKLDIESVKAAMIHETLKNPECTKEKIEEAFGEEIAFLVYGSNKLYMLNYDAQKEGQAENWRKMFMAIAKDARVVIIKLADRLNNMRHIKKEPPSEHRLNKAKETLEVYAPIAHRLGVQSIKWELEDLSMMIMNMDEYTKLTKLVTEQRTQRQGYIDSKIEEIKNKLDTNHIKARIDGRAKHFYSIYKKMKKSNKTIEEIYDLLAIRIITEDVQECYMALGIVHELYKPMPGRFKDYICNPKTNMYQSLHTTVFGENGKPFEIQIRTGEMHRIADYGIAAHFLYKEGKSKMSKSDEQLVWIRQTMELQNMLEENNSEAKDLNVDLFGDEVFVFTPKGDIINLPEGSCAVDFAYAIHQQVGNKMTGFKINNHIVPITTKLKNGDICSVITSDSSKGPGRDWLKFAKSSQAKTKIQQFFKKENREDNLKKGKELLEKEIKKAKYQVSDIMQDRYIKAMLEKYKYNQMEDCYAAIGYTGIPAGKIFTKLQEEYNKEHKEEMSVEEILSKMSKPKKTSSTGIRVAGIDNCLIKLAKCCNPLPGDNIIGYISIGQGVSVHKADCTNVNNINNINERQIAVEWENEVKSSYKANIYIEAKDRAELVLDISRVLAEIKTPILGMTTKVTKHKTVLITLTVQVSDIDELEKILRLLSKIDNIYEVRRGK